MMVVLKYLGIVVVFLLSLILSALLLFLVRQIVVFSLIGTDSGGVREVLIVIEWCASLAIATFVTYRLFGRRRTTTTRQDPRDALASDEEDPGAPVGPDAQPTASTEPLGGSEVPGRHVEGGAAALHVAAGTDRPPAASVETPPREATSGATAPSDAPGWRVRKPVLLLGAALLVAVGALGALGITWLVDSGVLRRDASDSPNAAMATPSSAPSLTANDEQVISFVRKYRHAIDGLFMLSRDVMDRATPENVSEDWWVTHQGDALESALGTVTRVGQRYAKLHEADSQDVAQLGAAFDAYLKSALTYGHAMEEHAVALAEVGHLTKDLERQAGDVGTLGGVCASFRELFARLWDGFRFIPTTESSSDSS